MADQRNISNLYNPMTVSELQQKYPYVPWLTYMNNLFNPYQTVESSDTVVLAGLKYFDNLNAILTRTPKRVQANYMYWRVVLHSISTLSKRIKKASEHLSLAMTGKVTRVPKWVQCVSYTSGRFSLATGALDVRRHFDRTKKESVLKIIKNVNYSFRHILEKVCFICTRQANLSFMICQTGDFFKVDWTDDNTKKAALEKLDNMAPLIAYPNELLEDEKLNDYYIGLEVNSKSLLKTELSIFGHFTSRLID